MNDSLGVLILKFLMNQISTYQATVFGSLMGGFLPFSRTLVTLYIVIVGYRILMGKTGERAKEWAVSMALLVLLQGILFESNTYAEWVTEPIRSTMFSLASLFSGGDSSDPFGAFTRLDAAMTTISGVADKLDPGGNFLTNSMAHIKVAIASFILMIVTGGLYMIYLVQVGLAIFAVYILFIIGGPFIFFAAFSETRFIAWTWFKTVMQYALWFVLISLVMGIGINGIELAAQTLANWDVVRDGVFTKQYALTLLMSAMVGYFLLKMSDLSAALTGGIGMQSNVAGSLVGGAVGTAGSAAMGAASRIGGPIASAGASAAGSIARGVAGPAVSGAVRAYSAMRGITQ